MNSFGVMSRLSLDLSGANMVQRDTSLGDSRSSIRAAAFYYEQGIGKGHDIRNRVDVMDGVEKD